MLRFRIKELLVECNRARPAGSKRMNAGDVALGIGVARSTLSNLTTTTREPVTNTAIVEALCRFFQKHHPNFEPGMLFEFTPALNAPHYTKVDELYPLRAVRVSGPRQRRE